MTRTYIGYDERGAEFDVKKEIQGYLDKIARLEKELAELKKKTVEKPKFKEVKSYE